jgi:CRISPR/Cas system CSM-associated protein Csm3 (group 7 of RAMP superfamily)
MGKVANLYFCWQQVSSLHSGYGQNLAQAVGKIAKGARRSAQLETHGGTGDLEPAVLSSSVKGVFRSASAWLVERTARELGATTYATCDYQGAVAERWRGQFRVPEAEDFCPICQVYGGAGCLAAVHRQRDEALRRRLSRVRFTFRNADDALHGSAAWGRKQTFAWEEASGRQGRLEIENFTPHPQPPPRLEVRIDEADDFALALVSLAADLIGSGLFRFGRFVSRGYGVVRLTPEGGACTDLHALLRGEEPQPWKAPDLEEMRAIVRDTVKKWLSSWKE